MHIEINELNNSHINAECVGKRRYKMEWCGLEIILKMIGKMCVVDVDTSCYLRDKANSYEIDIRLMPLSSSDYTHVTVCVSDIELTENKIEISLSSQGNGKLIYGGSQITLHTRRLNAINPSDNFNSQWNPYVLWGIVRRMSNASVSGVRPEYAEFLMECGEWSEVETVFKEDYVLLDSGELGYVRLVDFDESVRGGRGYMLCQDATYFIILKDSIEEDWVFADYCFIKGDRVSHRTSVISKRLL